MALGQSRPAHPRDRGQVAHGSFMRHRGHISEHPRIPDRRSSKLPWDFLARKTWTNSLSTLYKSDRETHEIEEDIRPEFCHGVVESRRYRSDTYYPEGDDPDDSWKDDLRRPLVADKETEPGGGLSAPRIRMFAITNLSIFIEKTWMKIGTGDGSAKSNLHIYAINP